MLVCKRASIPSLSVMSDVLLRTEGLSKEFAGFKAVSDVSFSVKSGTIHALIGPNGAGKTTLFNLLTKFLAPTAGRIFYKGRDITAEKPAAVSRLGIVRSFQISAVFPHLTVRENIAIALQRGTRESFRFWKHENCLAGLNLRTDDLAGALGLSTLLDTVAIELPYGRKRALELATTLALDPELVLLDEPTSGLSHGDIPLVSSIIKDAAKTRTVMMVEHNLSVVAELADTITVLTRGKILVEGTYAQISQHPDVREAYMGAGDD
jgi:branched-chain amino acid transport system ATP-binding protein